MAKASDIIRQIKLNIVKQTDLFSRAVSITSLTNSGGIATAVCATPHDYSTGNYIYIVGAQAPLQVSSITRVGNIATATTIQPHDLTKNPAESYVPTVKIVGADQPEYNGNALPVLSVPNRYKFTYQVSGSPVTPATGTILAYDGKERGYNSIKQITVIDPNTFTYPIEGNPQTAIGTITSQSNIRVSGAISDERAIESYTKMRTNEYWMFVILNNSDVSKDRNILNDSTGDFITGNDPRQIVIQNFMILVIAPTADEIAARLTRDTMEDVFYYLCKCLLRVKFDTLLSDKGTFGVTALGHEDHSYRGGYYVHQFNYQILNYILYDDTIEPDLNVAFRDIDLIINNSPDELVTAEINLDEEPA